MNEFKYEQPIEIEYKKWNEFNNGDIIVPEIEINKLIKGEEDENHIYKFIIFDNKLYSYPDFFPEGENAVYNVIKWSKLYSVTFD